MKIKYILIFVLFLFPIVTYAETKEVDTFSDLKSAIESGETDIKITSDMNFDSSISISNEVKIDGNDKSLNREASYTGNLFKVIAGGSLKLENLKMDLGASDWYMDYDNRYYTKPDNQGYVRVPIIDGDNDIIAASSLISNAGSLNLNNVNIKNGRSTASGTVMSGAGDVTLNDVEISHIFSSKAGGMAYFSGGVHSYNNIVIKDCCAGIPSVSVGGGAFYILNATSLNINGALFQDNYSQGNGTMFISKTNTTMNDVTFKHNMVGNDGSALHLESSVAGKTFNLTNGVFEDNIGFALTGQSMGTIWISKWVSTPEEPLVFKNTIFKNNKNRCGGGISDNGYSVTHVLIEDVEEYGTDEPMQLGGLVYGQTAGYTIKNVKVHDNKICAGGAIYSLVSPINISNSEIYNNTTVKSGGAINSSGGEVTIEDSNIYNNKSDTFGGGIYYRSYYNDNPFSLTVNNSIIKDNSADNGGGINISENEGLYTNVTINDQSKVYDNQATTSADDFRYFRNDNSDNLAEHGVTLNNLNLAGILGIDGWYIDDENNRFADAPNPEKFNNYVEFKGNSISLKSAGVNTLDYDLEGGTNDKIEAITVKYGVDTKISDDIPKKEGYVFESWNTKPDGTGQTIKPGDTYNGKAGLVLYAQYRLINPKTGRNILLFIIFTITLIGFTIGSYKSFKNKYN